MDLRVLHLQSDTEYRTLYESEPTSKQGIKLFLAYSGRSYEDALGIRPRFFESTYHFERVPQWAGYPILGMNRLKSAIDGVARFVKERDIDIVHVHKRGNENMLIATGLKVPCVTDVHDLISVISSGFERSHWLFRSPLLGKALAHEFYAHLSAEETRLLSKCESILVVSDAMRRILLSKGIPESRISIMRNTVPLSRLGMPKRKPNSDLVEVVFSSNFALGEDDLSHRNVRILFTNLSKTAGVRVHVYGNYSGRSWPQAEEFLRNCDNFVYQGFLTGNQYFSALNEGDIGLVYNNHKFDKETAEMSLPKKLFEYMSQGLPILAVSGGEVERFVTQKQIGAVFDDNSAKSISNALKEVKENYQRFSENCVHTIENEANWDRQSGELTKIYSRLASRE